MSDLISRQEAIDALDKIGSLDTNADKIYARELFKALPPAQSEQKKGKWIKKKSMIYCPNCYNGFEAIFIRDYNFCPNCGAKMEG